MLVSNHVTSDCMIRGTVAEGKLLSTTQKAGTGHFLSYSTDYITGTGHFLSYSEQSAAISNPTEHIKMIKK